MIRPPPVPCGLPALSLGAAHHDPCDPDLLRVCPAGARVASSTRPTTADPQARASPARRHAAHWANLNGRWEFRFDAQRPGAPRRLGKARRSGLRSHDRRPVPLGERAVRHSPAQRCARRSAGIAAASPSPTSFPAEHGSGSGSGRSTGEPTSGSTAGRSASTKEDTRPFDVDITDAVQRDAENVLVVRAFDPTDPSLPTGKQVGWYTPSSGIWQTVWLEAQAAGLHRRLPDHARDRAGRGHVRGRRRRYSPPGSESRAPASKPSTSSDGPTVSRLASPSTIRMALDARSTLAVEVPRPQALDSGDAPPLRRDARAPGRRRQGRSTRSRPISACAPSAAASTATSRSSEFSSTASRSTSARPSTSRSIPRGSTRRPTTNSSSAT